MTVLPFPPRDPGGADPASRHARDDRDARHALSHDLDDTLVVEAAAGTGKTTELITRIVAVLASGRARMPQVVAVTFTERAAGELKLRLRERLEAERAREQRARHEVERLDEALETLEEAHVNTIHGFCAELLRERPVEAGVDPLFTVLTEPQASALYERAFSAWLEQALSHPPEAVRRALRRTSAPVFGATESEGPVDRLRAAGRTLAEWREFDAPWQRPPFDRDARVDAVVARLHALADLSERPASQRDNLHADLDGVRRLSRQIRLEQGFGLADHDGWEARLVDLVRDRGLSRTRKGSGYRYGTTVAGAMVAGATATGATAAAPRDVTRTEVLAARDTLWAEVQLFKRDADADLAAGLQRDLAGATEQYSALKARQGSLDFADLLTRTRDVIRRQADVRRYLQEKFVCVCVDEFQDTDPVQAEILLLLSADTADTADVNAIRVRPGKLFIVGDPKQAIYRFRGTDVATYWRVADQLARQGGRVLRLSKSYRSVPEIQRFVNAAFAPAMVRDELALQADYVPLSPHREAASDQPSVVALPVPRPYGRSGPLKISAKAIDESLPPAVGALVAWLLNPAHGWTVSDTDANGHDVRRAVRPSDVAILFRRFTTFGTDVTRPYTDALEARGVPHLLVGGKSFHNREEVEMMRAALSAIEWPDDELSVFATLKGALFAIDDATLLEFKHRFGVFHPFRVPRELGGNAGLDLALTAEPTGHLVPVAEALRTLQTLHRRRNYRPVADTVAQLLEATRAHVGLVLRPAGEQVLANVLHVAELARRYEAEGGLSFRGFVDLMRTAAASEGAEAPILEESSDGVRLMTVHKAKGLEFPIVVLADLTCRLSRDDASRYLDLDRGLCAMRLSGWAPRDVLDHEAEEVARDEAEGVRLAYVAATRARDVLVVPAVGDEPFEGGWYSPLNAALYPPIETRRSPVKAAKCPAFPSKDTVLERPTDEPAGHRTVAPGQHPMPGGYSVVWWDPSVLDLSASAAHGGGRHELIVKDVPRDVIAEGRAQYDAWQRRRLDARTRGAAPSLSLVTVTEWVSAADRPAIAGVNADAVSIVDLTESRPAWVAHAGGAAFGTLVHAVLAVAPFGAPAHELMVVARREALGLGADQALAEAAASVVARVFAHQIVQRASAALAQGLCRRESPVLWRLDDGVVLEGVVDLAFEHAGGWHVVDFKTDRSLDAESEARYRTQVAIYAAAIAQATGLPTSATIVLA